MLGGKNWIPLSRAEYAGYNLEEALDQIKLEMLRILGEDGEEIGGED